MRILCSFLICLPSFASAADLLPLKRGIFVESKVTCSDRSNVNSMAYFGDMLNISHVEGKIQAVEKSGKTYTVRLDLKNDAGETEQATWTIAIASPKKMTIKDAYGTTAYRWCANKM